MNRPDSQPLGTSNMRRLRAGHAAVTSTKTDESMWPSTWSARPMPTGTVMTGADKPVDDPPETLHHDRSSAQRKPTAFLDPRSPTNPPVEA